MIQKYRNFIFYAKSKLKKVTLKRIGLITKKFLESDYSLIQARILFELNHATNIIAKDLVNELDLDSTYLSKILKQFETDIKIKDSSPPMSCSTVSMSKVT